ncbi:putative metal-binding motif-containing protein [Kangiella shandongensis]|uniref:putative metal-binding motif-containing protein n=1 Tax=Kangiella shandongensis TaxID=2763258 RepID=UPI001CBFC5B1|nr:putative metal-binding motif-containing protein [Kangiella shandongensis]
MKLKFPCYLCIVAAFALIVASGSIDAAQEIKNVQPKSKPTISISPKALKNIKKVKMISDTEYQKKLQNHQKLKSKAVKQKARANTTLSSQNKEFDETTYDCDDSRRDINIDAQEICDGLDNNCDGDVDMIDGRRLNNAYFLDADSDLWGDASKVYYACSLPDGYSERKGDCNDRDSSIHPGARDTPDNGIDENCDRTK